MATLTILALLWWRPAGRSEAAETVPAAGQAIKLDSASRLWLEGDSTLHKYRLDAKELDVRFGEGSPVGNPALETLVDHNGIKTLDVRIAVAKLTSGEGGLDDNMRKALDADKHPEIRFQMDSYQASRAGTAGSAGVDLSLAIKGRLQIAGVEKPIELEAAATHDGTALHVTGVKQLLMTDYGIKKPTFMLGMMSVSDPIAVHFDLKLDPNP
jgi:hypothetical protein